MDNDRFFMREAVRVATENGSDPSLAPIGCVIVMNGGVLAACRNKVREHHDAFVGDAYRDDLLIEGGLLREECAALYYRPWDNVPTKEQANL